MNLRLKRAVELSRAVSDLKRARLDLEDLTRVNDFAAAERYAASVVRHDRAVREMRLGDRPTPV